MGEPGDLAVNSLTLDDPRRLGPQDLPELTGVKTENAQSRSKGSSGGSKLTDTSVETTLGFKGGNGESVGVVNGSTANINDRKGNNDEFLGHGKKGSQTDLTSSSTSLDIGRKHFLRLLEPLSNYSKPIGSTLRLKCIFESNPGKIKVSWYKNEAPLEPDERIEIKQSKPAKEKTVARLKIQSVMFLDSGFYKCEANNGKDTMESVAIVRVDGDDISSHLGVIPTIDDEVVPEFPQLNSESGIIPGYIDKFDVEDKVKTNFCEPYRGTVCSQVIGNQTIYVETEGSQDILEGKIVGVFTVIKSSRDISHQCHRFAIPSLCLSIFPLCSQDLHHMLQHKPRQVCRDECEMLEHQICHLEYTIAKRHPLIGQANLLPACEKLAPSGSIESADCVRLGVPNVVQVIQDDTCYQDNGENYRGTTSRTVTGVDCAPWHQQVFYKTADYPELIGGHNYCRNPGGMESQPWCFIREPEMKKVYCDVPRCVDNFWVYIVVPSLGALVLFILLLALCCLRRKPRSKSSGPQFNSGRQSESSISNLQSSRNGVGGSGSVEMNSLLPKKQSHATEYPLSCLKFIEVLGEGAFGKVYRGELIMSLNDTVPIAIKTLKEDANMKTRQDFQREADLMADLIHPNIVCLLGVCFKEEPMCMMFEFMSEGDLHEYLITHSPGSEMVNKDGTRPRVLDINDFLHISTQIGAGMEYLGSHHYVHRDLAARNCLVSDHLTVKISDFGLSRDIYASDYYRVHSKSLLPVRWMPPESILYGKFTTESDVWSFGVLLWEIFSYGLQPYYGYTNQQVIDMIRGRHLLPCPSECPPNIYSLMNQCWTENPAQRPSFSQLHQRLRNWKAVYSNTIASTTLPSASSHSSSHSGINLMGSTLPHHHNHNHQHQQHHQQPQLHNQHKVSLTLGSRSTSGGIGGDGREGRTVANNNQNLHHHLIQSPTSSSSPHSSSSLSQHYGLTTNVRQNKDAGSPLLTQQKFPVMNHQTIQQHFNGHQNQTPYILNQHHFITTNHGSNSPSNLSNRSIPTMTGHTFKGHHNSAFN
ncbi:tyrosine-protein kinase transmembrane receptor Ror isoform X2 [Tetranychus urticae]|uniref:tyrosine-protein kinase transmembrane receptor Ror isoform X2 n=1 Tax=Tetranychus urticae TaxID=32264 RepID=UPI00077B92BE|nr:tyrosine-protein kinase transmembrane receptor Ror isoform X2 [Tetranychus urticae]